MKSFSDGTEVYLWQGVVDMRTGFDRLAAFVSEHLSQSVINSGGVYLFFSKCRTKVKLLYWDKDGYALWYKRLEAGKYRIPRAELHEMISVDELDMLLSGTDFSRIKLAKNAEKGSFY